MEIVKKHELNKSLYLNKMTVMKYIVALLPKTDKFSYELKHIPVG